MDNEKFTYMRRRCQICGKEYQARYKDVDDIFLPIYWDNCLHLRERTENGWRIWTNDICEDCTKAIVNVIKERSNKHIVGSEDNKED